ncbi:Uu.00g115080.m01.CDS01 [Anthostomella pinea]|uniref:Uu.00g115080.m01.CDS01 n=1 Tax=Anthostomella pinea TaxID=933095 RepID=A0AAI8VFR2_9PEZI|nr:Uu.00g115080.m01.CDS01 [Anthostomella pinea]
MAGPAADADGPVDAAGDDDAWAFDSVTEIGSGSEDGGSLSGSDSEWVGV